MNNRFPFRNNLLSNLEEAFLLQQSQNQSQNELQVRLLQQQMNQEQQLRSITSQLGDYADLQSTYQQQQQQPFDLGSRVQQARLNPGDQIQAQYQEELLRRQQLQLLQQQQQQQNEEAALLALQQQQRQQQLQAQPHSLQILSNGLATLEPVNPLHHLQAINSRQQQIRQQQLSALGLSLPGEPVSNFLAAAAVTSPTGLAQQPPVLHAPQVIQLPAPAEPPVAQMPPAPAPAPKRKRAAKTTSKSKRRRSSASAVSRRRSIDSSDGDYDSSKYDDESEMGLYTRRSSVSTRSRKLDSPSVSPPFEPNHYNHFDVLESLVIATDTAKPIFKGSIDQLVGAIAMVDTMDGAARVLGQLKRSTEQMPGLFEPPPLPKQPAETFQTPLFQSSIPALPEEPQWNHLHFPFQLHLAETKANGTNGTLSAAVLNMSPNEIREEAVLDYPVPVDTWWPSASVIQRERRTYHESSDEDDFEDTVHSKRFRANEMKIRKGLRSNLEPGVLEKIPHCRIHRVRTKRKTNSSAPELVHCFQCTEIYPNDIMVQCSKCGTWRHAACGGHFEPISQLNPPDEIICENCHEESSFLTDYPNGARRLEMQRTAHLRRSLMTSAVMRSFACPKQSLQLRWPLGSVPAYQLGVQARNVHARHDKAEKHWADMMMRLNRDVSQRPKDFSRFRTKEYERLLTAIEDAESQTDRHNMMLFLRRDTRAPTGLKEELRNIFDPAEDAGMDDERNENMLLCTHCGQAPARYDSQFCSNRCGVASLEQDLLMSLEDSEDLHPSQLRSTGY